jgi:hypothetical protein
MRGINCLAYCAAAIAEEAQAMANVAPIARPNAAPMDTAIWPEALDLDILYLDLEKLEQHLVAIEEKMIAPLRDATTCDWSNRKIRLLSVS